MAGSSSRIVAVVAVAALAVGAGVLSVLALQRTERTDTPQTAPPAPTFSFAPGGGATSTPTPTATPDAGADAAAERFAAVFGDQVWRATAGSCAAPEVAPVVEYSTDDGATWIDVTPADARQVLQLAAFGEGQGEVIAATGDDCAPAALRTYTAGRAWESYPNVLAGSTYVDPADRARIVMAGSPVAAPCADVRSVRSSRGVVGVVCDGVAYVGGSTGQWTEVTPEAIALDAVSGTIVVAHSAAACSGGVAVTRYASAGAAAGELGCVSDVDAATPAALSVLDDALVLWSGDAIHHLD